MPPPARGGPLAPLAWPRFRALWLAGLVSFLGTWVHNTAARWSATTLSGKPSVVAAVDTLQLLPMMLLAVAAGRLADRYDRRRILVATHLGYAFVAGAMAVWAALGHLDVPFLLAMTAAIGVLSAITAPAWQATVPRQVPDAQVPAAVAVMSTGFNLARAIGPTLGAWVLVRGGAGAAFGLNALSYAVIGLLFWRMPPQPPPPRPPGPRRSPVTIPALRRYYAIVLWFGVCANPALSLLPLVARDHLAGGAPTYGLLLSGFGFGAAGAGLLIARGAERFGATRLMALAAAGTGLGLAGLSVSTTLPMGVAGTALCGMGWIATLATANARVQVRAPAEVRGSALAWHLTAAVGGQALGSLLGGLLAEAWGVGAALAVDAVGVGLLSATLIGNTRWRPTS